MQIYIQRSEKTMLRSLDLFFFHDDELRRLDAYQHVEAPSETPVEGIAGSGKHILAAISNYPGDSYSWMDIQSFSQLSSRQFHLEDDDPANPLLYGVTGLEEGRSRSCKLKLEPMLSALRIRSLSCDFSGRAYAGEKLKSISIYLIHVNSVANPLSQDGIREESYINQGYLDRKAVESLSHPEMLYMDLDKDVGEAREEIDCTLYAYPNPISEESLGRTFTRFVIEGSLAGKTCYYPINLPGLGANKKYTMDITLTRMGSPDPDIPAETGSIILETDIKQWAEFDEYSVRF